LAGNEYITKLPEIAAERRFLGQKGVNMGYEIELYISAKVIKLLSGQQLTDNSRQWRRGDSNPLGQYKHIFTQRQQKHYKIDTKYCYYRHLRNTANY
jgi:hypothetical protein